ncbi:MAG TPA: phospholipid carrier-dependent glycosyltransferase, partial [Aggregatilineales bacterium]|nr:phospholipid carrier-dependent glycosyltransferase [Aggregatilineales bacterium]
STTGVLGWYAAASRFIEAAKMPPFALFGAIFPLMSAQPESLKRIFRHTSAGLALYGFAAGLGFTLLGSALIIFTFGTAFKNATPILTLLGWTLIPVLLRQNLITRHYAENRERFVNWMLLAILPVQLLLGVIFIDANQGEGAAVAVLISETILLMLLWRGNLQAVIFLMLIAMGLAARLAILRDIDFDGLYGQDAFAYFAYGLDVRESLSHFQTPGMMNWPLGFPVLLAAGFSLFGTTPEIAQMSVLITGALAGGFMFLLVYDLLRLIEKSKREALVGGMVAGLLLSFSGQLIQSSVVVMADAPALLWAVISAWCLVRYAHSRHNAWIAAAAFTL